MSEVVLEVYDLSHGMAAAMSQSILGMRIDGIWHTGVVVFNKEYYFGGGIQCSPVGHFAMSSGMRASRSERIGLTTKTQSEFETYLRSINHQYTESTYDLINNNCNNFSDCICKFLTGVGIPSYIIDLPRTVFTSPGGAMLRPMIENMQNSIRQQRSGSLNPFPSSSAPISQAPAAQIFETSLSQALREGVTSIVSDAVTRANIKAQLEESPTISADSSTLPSIANKILQLTDESGAPGSALTESEKTFLQAAVSQIGTKSVAAGFEREAYAVLNRLLLSNNTKSYLNCLFLLRLMALLDHRTALQSVGVYETVINKLSNNDFSSVAVQCIALCTISNLLSHQTGTSFIFTGRSGELQESSAEGNDAQPLIGQVVDITVNCMAHNRQEVRQISSTLAYNLILACTQNDTLSGLWVSSGELHPTAVQLLCGCLESIFQQQYQETAAVRGKKLACICRIMRGYGAAAVSLLRDLGFVEQLETLISTTEPPLTKDEAVIVEEILSIAVLHQ
eukprot:gene26292-34917_t